MDRRIDDLAIDATTMSIYRSRQKRPLDDNTVQLARPNVATATASGPPPAHPAQDQARLRRANPVDYLLPASIQWLKGLPRDVRPYALGARYPRIVNLIVELWNDYPSCWAYFEDLLIDHRGSRQGFPPDVYKELRALHEYYHHLPLTADGGRSLV